VRTWRILLLLVFVCASATPAIADDYYVSTSVGNDRYDGRNGVVAGVAGPFASVKPLQTITLRHGDRILFRCGEKFAGPLRLTLDSQTPGELTLGSYGECVAAGRPTLDGRVPFAGVPTGQVQQFAEPEVIAQMFAGDTPLPRARFPAYGYLIVSAAATPSTVSLAPFAPLIGRTLQGARLHARTQEWFIEERAVNGADGQLEAALQYPLRPKSGFYLTGKSWMIGDKNAWSYDTNSHQLAVRAAPGSSLLKVSSGHLLTVSGRGSVTVAGIDFDAAGGDAIYTHLDGVVTIKDVGIKRAVGNGIAITGARNAFIVNSDISDVGLDAIFFAETKRAFVRRNRLTNAGLYAGPRPSLAAINAHRTESATIEENIVENSAYIGIRFAGDARVRRNYVSQSCLYLSDCAALYTWRRNAQDRRPHSEIVGNLIDGAKGDTSVKLGVNDYFAGIYLDEFSNDVLVADNLMVDVNQGIYLHNAYNNEVRNNVVRARLKTVIDAADKAKLPAATDTANTVASNSERLGSYGVTLVDPNGNKQSFSFDELPHVEIAPLPANATKTLGRRNCTPDQVKPPALEKAVVAYRTVTNCD
jgi:parallel beta-helix repeat protein